jgi:putative molybdopterin biosynthesis protein
MRGARSLPAGGDPSGFPTSAMFTFREFVAPVLRALAGHPAARDQTVPATLPMRINSERGRTEYVLASLMRMEDGSLAAYRTSKGSGAVTAPRTGLSRRFHGVSPTRA